LADATNGRNKCANCSALARSASALIPLKIIPGGTMLRGPRSGRANCGLWRGLEPGVVSSGHATSPLLRACKEEF
jgi:hypothetical protein